MKISQVSKYAAVAIAANIPVMFHGAPGLGKSDLARQLARDSFLISALAPGASQLPVVDLRAGNFDRVDLQGIPSVVNGVTVWNPPALLPLESRDGPAGILLLDEFTNAPLSVQGAFLQLLLERKLGEYVLPAGWRIIACGNRQADRASANRLSTAAGNRLAHFELTADSEDWLAWAAPANVHPVIVAFIKFRPAMLHVMPEPGAESGAFPSPRSWEMLSRALWAAGADWQAMAGPLAAAIVGTGAELEFTGFVACWGQLPRLPDIESNPQGAPVPSEMTAKYACAAMLGRAATLANMDSVCIYLDRLGPAFSELGIQQAIGRAPALKETAGYVARSIRNQQYAI